MTGELSAAAITRDLDTAIIGQRVLYYPVTTSTMDAAREAGRGKTADGTVVIAGEQTAARGRIKRGGDWVRTTLETGLDIDSSPPLDLIQLDEALDDLAARDPRAARAVELHYFAGIGAEDTARALEVSESTVFRDLRIAKAYLYRALTGE